jgi:CspA family cold shock protein
MHTGKVKFFNKAKGYGFIVRDDNNEEIFVHATGLIDDIHQNDSVSFELKEGKKGVNATDVKVVAG